MVAELGERRLVVVEAAQLHDGRRAVATLERRLGAVGVRAGTAVALDALGGLPRLATARRRRVRRLVRVGVLEPELVGRVPGSRR
jgi:hypothetical protein